MIRRAALERMCAHYPELQFKRDHSIDAATASDKRFALFECMIAEDGTYLSEDFAFCKRWTDMGGEIWADLGSKLSHVGPMVFCGDLSSQFAGADSASADQANISTRLPLTPSRDRIEAALPTLCDASEETAAGCWFGGRGDLELLDPLVLARSTHLRSWSRRCGGRHEAVVSLPKPSAAASVPLPR